jgi:ribosomal protein S18 acetylase RimI-like enzyme
MNVLGKYEVRLVTVNKKDYMPLLLLGDEQESYIDAYLERGDLFALYGGDLKSVCVVTDEGGGVLEIQNLATDTRYQQQGYATCLINYVANHYAGQYGKIILGTGDVPGVLSFYEKCGFVKTHRIADYFTTHYDHPMIEDGVLLKDKVYLERKLKSRDVRVREITRADYPVLEDFLYNAIFVPLGEEMPPREIIFTPEIYIYIKDFSGKHGDCGVVAEQDGKIIGAAWTRIIPAYGHIDDDTPELAISVLPEYRGQNIGTMMMNQLFDLLRERGYKRTSLSVQQDNPAVNFYKRLGYKITDEKADHVGHEDYIMVKELKITLRPFCDKDIPLMERWLYADHVKPWYEHPLDWLKELRERDGEFSFITHLIAEIDGEPIGFCQYYNCYHSREYEDWGMEIPAMGEIYSIDYMIGKAEYLRKGHAGSMIVLLLDTLREIGAKAVIVLPDIKNTASNKTLEATGFCWDGERFILRLEK